MSTCLLGNASCTACFASPRSRWASLAPCHNVAWSSCRGHRLPAGVFYRHVNTHNVEAVSDHEHEMQYAHLSGVCQCLLLFSKTIAPSSRSMAMKWKASNYTNTWASSSMQPSLGATAFPSLLPLPTKQCTPGIGGVPFCTILTSDSTASFLTAHSVTARFQLRQWVWAVDERWAKQ